MATSPFGKYASLAALIGASVIIGVWAIQHILNVPDPEVDKAFLIAIGIVLGTGALQQQATVEAARHLNGTLAELQAINRRLDRAGIPAGTQITDTLSPDPHKVT